MGIGHHGSGAARHDGAREFARTDHAAFKMDMGINEAGRHILAFEIQGAAGLTSAKPHDMAVGDGNMGIHDFAQVDIDQAGITQEQIHRPLAPGRMDQTHDGRFGHDRPPFLG